MSTENATSTQAPGGKSKSSAKRGGSKRKAGRKAAMARTASKRTAANAGQTIVDARVEAETKRLNDVRARQEADDRARREAEFKVSENSLGVRAADASIGLVEHFNCAGRYVGVAPQFEKGESKCPSCQEKLTGGNSRFIPLPSIAPEAGLLVKDPNTGDFFALPGDGTLDRATAETWLIVINPATGKGIIPEANKTASKARREGIGLT